jgi:hypothetical protein
MGGKRAVLTEKEIDSLKEMVRWWRDEKKKRGLNEICPRCGRLVEKTVPPKVRKDMRKSDMCRGH